MPIGFLRSRQIPMGATYTHRCDHCGYTVITSGPWEFYRDSSGARHFYGSPAPISEEAKTSGISGLSGQVYCTTCDKVYDLVLIELKTPTHHPWVIWIVTAEPDDYKQNGVVTCPECGNTNLALSPQNDLPCPRCGEGHMNGQIDPNC